MTPSLIIFSFLFSSYYLARKIDGGNTSLWLIMLLSVVLLSVEVLSALTVFGKTSLAILGMGYVGVVVAFEWKTHQKKREEEQKSSEHLWIKGSSAKCVILSSPVMSALRYALAAARATQGDTTGRNEGRFAEVPKVFSLDSEMLQNVLPLGALFFAVAVFYAFFPIAEIDSVSYHLPIASQLIRTGSAWDVFQAGYVGPSTYFPANHEALQAFLMSVLGNTHLNFIITLLGILLFYHALRNVADRKVPAVLTFLSLFLVMSIPFLFQQLLSLQIDLFLLCLLGSATAFLLSGILHKRRLDAFQCFLTLGLALGTKYNAFAQVIFLLPFLAWLALRLKAPLREWWWFPALSFLTGGFWYLRNWIVASNPLYPFGIKVLHWEGHRKILADMAHTSLWDATVTHGVRETFKNVLQNDHFSSLLGKISLTIIPFTFALVLFIILLSAFFSFAKRRSKEISTHQDKLHCLIFIGLLYLLIATAVVYATSPYTFTLWNEVVRYSAGFFAIIPIALVLIMYVQPNGITVLITLYAIAIAGYNIIFKSFLFDPNFNAFLREKATSISDRTVLLMIFSIALIFISVLINAKKLRLVGNAVCIFLVAVALSIFSSSFPLQTSADDVFLSTELSGYARLLPTIQLLRQEPNKGTKIIALAGLTPYWIFEKEGFNPIYLNIDGCDLCKYPEYRNKRESVRSNPNEHRWKELVKKRQIEYLLVDTKSRTATSVPYEKIWADTDHDLFRPLLSDQDFTLYRVNAL